MAVSRDNLTAWLRDAYAMENQAIEILEKQANRLEHYPELRAKVRSHLDESHRQAERVERCLHQLGTDTSGLKTALGKIVGTAQQLSGLFASDEVLKSGIADYAFEHYEIASYKMLIAAAGRGRRGKWRAFCRRICAKRRRWLRGSRSICRRSRVSTCTEKPRGRWRKSNGRHCEQGYGNPGEEQSYPTMDLDRRAAQANACARTSCSYSEPAHQEQHKAERRYRLGPWPALGVAPSRLARRKEQRRRFGSPQAGGGLGLCGRRFASGTLATPGCCSWQRSTSGFGGGSAAMYSIFYIIGVVVVILAVLSLLGIR